MVTKLTEKQEKIIDEFSAECLKIGRDTSQEMDRSKVEEVLKKFYSIIGLEQPKYYYCDSPMQAHIIIHLLKDGNHYKIYNALESKGITDATMASLKPYLATYDFVKSCNNTVWDSIASNLAYNMILNAEAEADDLVETDMSLIATIIDVIENGIPKEMKMSYMHSYLCGQHDINWIGYYMYYYLAKLLEKSQEYDILEEWMALAKNCGWIYARKNYAFICQKPNFLSINDTGQLHRDGGPCLTYRDSFSLHCLNGVTVQKEIAETPAEELDANLILSESNVDVQRQIINKIGPDNIYKRLNAHKIDEWIDKNTGLMYQLMCAKTKNGDKIKYLYYEHAVLKGNYYASPVPPETQKALHARAWIVGLIDREDLQNITSDKENELQNALPDFVS